MYKNYHSEDMLLLIVMLINNTKNYSIPFDVPNKDSVKIINFNFFLNNTFNFKDSIKKKIIFSINLAKKAPYSLIAYNQLKEISNSANKKLKINFGNRKDQQFRYNEIRKKDLI